MNFLLTMSKTLDLEFKSLFAEPTIEEEPILASFVSLLRTISQELHFLGGQRLQTLKQLLEVILGYLRGSAQANIQLCICKDYHSTLQQLLTYGYDPRQLEEQEMVECLLTVKRLAAENLFKLIPYISRQPPLLRLVETELTQQYVLSRKLYPRSYQDIILDFADPEARKTTPVLYFRFALQLFFCLVELYSLSGSKTIFNVQWAILNDEVRKRRLEKQWEILYQIYRIFADIFSAISQRLSSTYEDLTLDRNQEELLQRAIAFFAQHVGSVEVRVGGSQQTISFLKLKEAQCRNYSIRQEVRRWTNYDQGLLRVSNFLAISKYIVVRLEVERAVLQLLENFKPLEIIVKNRELWKRVVFALAIVLSYFYTFVVELSSTE
jgi:hypothetical protein